MAVATHVHRALDAVAAEREAVAAKHEAYEEFASCVESVQPERRPSAGGKISATGSLVTGRGSREEGCRTVRTAFAETVRPHSVADVDDGEPLLETIRSEFTGPIATALSPATEATFGSELKQSLLAQADARRREALLMRTTLERERDQLADAVTVLDRVTGWIATADETPLSELGFEELCARHDQLSAYRQACDAHLRARQAFLDRATSHAGETGLRHREVVEYCYADLPVTYPVLSTVTRLAETCGSCQDAVRSHLAWRG